MENVAVIGAGEIGIGVAQSFATNKFKVILIDKSEENLNDGFSKIKSNLRFSALFGQSLDSKEILANISLSTNISEISKCTIIIENITEDTAEKIKLYNTMKNFLDPVALIMVNTSCIPIASLAARVNQPKKVIGVHFMNPVPMKEYVEVIKQQSNTSEVILETITILERIGKKGIIVNDQTGFVSNRISHIFMNEAAHTLNDGVASAENIDLIFKNCFGHKMGPLETADLIGIDTVVNSLNVLFENFGEEKYKCCPLLLKMVADNKLGRKTGNGFYSYI